MPRVDTGFQERKLRVSQRVELARRMLSGLTEVECAYIAGLIDGEGSMGIYESSAGNGHTNTRVSLVIANTSSDLHDWLLAKLPGGKTHWTVLKTAGNKRFGQFSYSSTKSVALLQRCIPYMVIKRRQAELVNEFYLAGPDKDATEVVTNDEKRRRADVQQRLAVEKQRNHKGRTARPIYPELAKLMMGPEAK